MKRTAVFAIAAVVVSLCGVVSAADVTSTWDGSVGDWSDSSRWDSLLFPNNGNGGLTYDAVISSGTVTVDQAIDIENLQQTNGTITGISDLTISGLTTWTGGTMDGVGTTYANGGMDLSGSSPKRLDGRVLNNAGAATWTAGALYTGNGAVFNNQLGATFDTNFNGSFWNALGGAESQINNLGSFTKSGGTGGATQIDIPFHNTGAVEVNSGQLSFRGGGTSSGSFIGAAGTTLSFYSATYDLNTGSSVTSNGTVQIGSGTWNFNDGTYIVTGTTAITGGTANFLTTPTINQLNLSAGILGGTADITASGMLTWTGGTMTGAGTTYANGGLNLSGNTPKRLDGRVLNNAGAATWTVGQVVTGNGAIFNNQLGATFDTTFDGGFFNGIGGAESTFNNLGTFIKSGGAGGATEITIPFHNTGTVEVSSGELHLRGGGTSSGSYTGATGTTLNFGGGIHDLNTGSSVTSAGTVEIGNGTWNLNDGTFDVSGTTSIIGGTANFFTTPTINQLNLSAGTLGGTADITVSGMLTWTGGTMTGAGTTYANGGLNLSGNTPKNLNGRVLNNAGAATWTVGQVVTGNGAIFNNQLGATFDTTFDGGLFNGIGGTQSQFNNAGTFTKSGGTGGATQIDIPFHNTGAVEVNSGQLSFRGGGTSSGSFTGAVGTTMDFSGGSHNLNTGSSVTSAGTVQIGSGTWNFNDGTFDVSGTTSITGGTANFFTTPTINQLNLSAGTLGGTADITVSGMLTWTGGTMTGAGTTYANGGLNLSGNTPKNLNGRVLNNAGAANWTGGQFVTGNGAVFNNQLGATFDTTFDGGLFNGIGGTQSQFNNAGTFTKSGETGGATQIEIPFHNTGTLEVNSGQLFLMGGGVNTGSMKVTNGATLSLDSFIPNDGHMMADSGGHLLIAESSPNEFYNKGTLEARGGSITVPKTSSISGKARVTTPLDPFYPFPAPGGNEFWGASLLEGTWIAGPGQTIYLQQLIANDDAGETGAALRFNYATIVLDGPGSNITTVEELWSNDGTIEIRGGRDLVLNGPSLPYGGGPSTERFLNRGTIRVGAGSTFTFGDFGVPGITNSSGSRLEGEGVIEGPVSTNGTTFSSNSTLTINRGQLSILTSTSTLEAGTLEVNVPMYVSNGGHFVIAEGATLAGTGILELQDGLVTIEGTLAKPVRITGPFEVGGTIADGTLEGASLTAPNEAGFGLLNCFGENNIQSGVINVNGQLLVNDGTLTLSAGASVNGPGAINILGLGNARLFGHLTSTGNATIAGSLAVEAGATAQAANWHFVGKSLVNVKGKIKSSTPAEVTGTLAVDLAGEIDVPNIKLLGIPGVDPAKLKGTGKTNGDVEAGTFSTVASGFSPGMLTIGGNMTFAGGSTLEFEVRDAQGISGTDYDLLVVESDLINIGTTVDPMMISLNTLDLLDEAGQAINFDNTQDYTWTIATAIGTISGFSTGTYLFDESSFLNDLGSGAFFLSLGDSGHALNVVFSASGLPSPSTGDFDEDGDVDGRDFLTWQRGGSPTPLGPVDLANWQANYGVGGLSAAANVAVPEPASFLLSCGMAMLLILSRQEFIIDLN